MNHRISLIVAVCLCAFGLSACGPKAKPFSLLHPEKGTFSMVLTTNVIADWSGTAERREVDANVPVAKKAIMKMTDMGYKYVPGGKGGEYDIKVMLTCYDPLLVQRLEQESAMLDMMYPMGVATYAEAREAALMDVTAYQFPTAKKNRHCTGRVFMEVRVAGEKDGLYSGGGFGETAYRDSCAYPVCGPMLEKGAMEVLEKVFGE